MKLIIYVNKAYKTWEWYSGLFSYAIYSS